MKRKKLMVNAIAALCMLMLTGIHDAFGQYRVEIPAPQPREQVVHHENYSLSYIKAYELSSWVAYELTAQEASGNIPYRESFSIDPLVASGPSTLKDYKKSGYLMGQLAPVADMQFSETAIKESFYLSNVVPQKPGFNKFTWLKMGDVIRAWAKECGSLYIVTGSVLSDSPFPTFGKSMVSVPARFYKVVLDLNGQRGVGFLVKNSITATSLKPYAMSIDKVEEITGIDFFPSLPDDLENRIESTFNPDDWNFTILE